MNCRSFGLALVTGAAVFLIVGVAVTELAQSWSEFSLFLGIPIGFAAGAFTVASVYLGLADDAPGQRRHIAGTFAVFGVAFLVGVIVLGGVLDIGITLVLGIAFVVALLVGAGVYSLA